MQHQAGEVAQLEQRHEDVDGGQRRAERLQLHHLLQPGEELVLVGWTVAHPAERKHQLLDHLVNTNKSTKKSLCPVQYANVFVRMLTVPRVD